ncbi:phospholipase D-like domain-containing protein [Salsuginibacillus kocurii]|uniref:phospholipase D-like domain-containing protein n=1 Tax=Salsuginibacillus kocurii TaxID=427078 RepID=UPI00036D594D|nr:phospholipase D-like domain-containing protein [Salsuginibacillus kocurii]
MLKKYPFRVGLAVLFICIVVATLAAYFKPLPPGLSYEGELREVEQVDFLFNRSLPTESGGAIDFEDDIYVHLFQAIEEAESFIVLDMFLINSNTNGESPYPNGKYPPLSNEVKEALLEKKERDPHVDIVVITDPINTSYNSHSLPILTNLQEAGIETVLTNLDPLQDPNPLYSGIWRMFIQWFGQEGKGWIPNPFGNEAPAMTLRSGLMLLNAKANHRKVVVTDQTAIVSSANVNDKSYYFTNAGFQVYGEIVEDIVAAEQAVLNFSGGPQLEQMESTPQEAGDYKVQVLTESKNFERVLSMLEGAGVGEEVWIGMFYVSDRAIIDAILEASERGAKVRMILDPNTHVFGLSDFGMPNPPVAKEMLAKDDGELEIRWYNSDKQQFHVKMMAVFSNNDAKMLAGSANFSAPNMENRNLDMNLYVESSSDAEAAEDVKAWFEEMWTNDAQPYTFNYETYEASDSFWSELLYRLQKRLNV